MLSKNNNKELMRKQEPKKQRFAIKKLTVGVASVLIGFTFMGLSVSAHASDDATATAAPATEVAAGTQNESASAQPQSQAPATNATDQNSVAGTQSTQTVNVGDLAGQGTAAGVGLTDNKVEEQPTVNLDSTDNLTNFQNFSKAIVNKDVSNIVLDADLDLSKLSSHNLGLSQDADVHGGLYTGGTTGDFHATDLHAYELGAGDNKTPSQFNGIARKLVIDGNGHSLNMGKWYISLWNQNYTADKTWDITFKNFKEISANNTNALFTLSGRPINGVSADNAKRTKITFDGIQKLNLNNAPLADSGYDVVVKNSTFDTNGYAVIKNANTVNVSNVKGAVADGDFITGTVGDTNINGANLTVNNGSLVDTANDVNFNGTNTVNSTVNSYKYNLVKAGHVAFNDGNTTLNMKTANGTSLSATERKGNIIFASGADNGEQHAVDVKSGATLTMNGQSTDLRGIQTNDGTGAAPVIGSVYVEGNVNANMSNGHSTAIWTGNLNIGNSGVVTINTKQDNEADGVQNSWANDNTDYNGTHYAPITIGSDLMMDKIPAKTNSLVNNGKLTIIRDLSQNPNYGYVPQGSTMTPLISMGVGLGAGAKYVMTVGGGATLDLQDNGKIIKNGLLGNTGTYDNTTKSALITMWGSSGDDKLEFNNPTYVNLQRTGKDNDLGDYPTGTLVRLEGSTNKTSINGGTNGTPVSQWDQALSGNTPSFTWYVKNEENTNNTGDNAISGFVQNATPKLKKGTTFINAGTSSKLTMSDNATPGAKNSFENNFNWWKAQRIAIGNNGTIVIHDADQYKPEAQTITTTVGSTLSSTATDPTGVKSGIKDFIGVDGTKSADANGNVDWTKSHWYNASTDGTEYNKQFTVIDKDGNSSVVNTPKVADLSKAVSTSNTATIVYKDGSMNFVDVPITVTDGQTPVTPTTPTKTEADQYDPKGQNVTTTVNVLPDAKNGISNVSDLPSNATYTWATQPDVSKAGTVPAIVNVTYGDGSQDQVPVNVIINDANNNVPDTTGDAEANDPQGQEVTTTIGKTPDAKDAIKWPAGQPVDGNGTAIDPSTITYKWSSVPDVYSQGEHPGVVQITYPDGTVDFVPATVDVTNTPTGKHTNIPENGTVPDAGTVIDWGNGNSAPTTDPNYPGKTTSYEWTTKPDPTKPGDQTGVVTITYPNGEKVPVQVPVRVTTPTSATAPYADPINYKYNQTVPTDSSTIGSYVTWPSGSAPADATYTWGTAPDTSKANTTQNALIIATYTDPNDSTQQIQKKIPVIVNVGSMADYYTPSATDLTVPHNADMSKYAASKQISGVPSNVVSYDAWAPMPVTQVAGTQPTMIKVTYTDGSFDYVPLNVHVYAPEYAETSVAQGGTQTVTPTWTADKGDQKVSFASTAGTPSWATVDTDGTVTLKPGTDVNAGGYAIPVQVTYNNGSKETVYVPVMVTGNGQEDNNTWTVNGDTMRSFSINTFDTHKTNDGSGNAMAGVNPPQIGTISYAKEAYNKQTHQYKDVAKITYKLNNDKTKYVVDSILLNGQTISNPTLAQVQQVKSDAVLEFNATDVTTSWMPASDQWSEGKDRTPNTDASNFNTKGDGNPGSGTKTSTAQSQYGDPNGDQRSTESQLSGNSRARANIELSGDAQNIFGVAHEGWINVFGNFYGAETNQTLTFKQGQDISNLTQDQYRQLINVTDLGAAGWNGVNVNPNAPQVLAYVPGTDTAKTFTMSWAPNGQPSTETVKNGVSGTVRIHFNDGTWLDIPATINVVADPDAGKTDQDKTEFTQKIVYTYNGKEVATTNIDNIAKGTDVSAATLKSTIDANVPNNYSIAAGYTYPAGLTNVTATPTILYVPLTLNSGETFSDTGKIVYRTEDGTHTWDGNTIKSNDGDILTAALLKDLADQKVPAGYHIIKYPASYTVTGDKFTIPVIVAKNEPSTPTTQNFNQDVQYKTADGTVVKTASGVITGTLTNGSGTVAMNDANSLIDSNMPTGYHYVSGKLTQNETVNSANPAALVVIVAQDGGQVTPPATKKASVTYTFHDDTDNKTVGTPVVVTGNEGQTLPTTVTIPGSDEAVIIHLVHATTPVTPGQPGVTPDNPDYADLFHKVTRTINVENPVTHSTDTTEETVEFGRTGVKDDVTGEFLPDQFGAWKVYNTANNTLTDETTGTWNEFDAPEFSGYTPSQAVVEAKTVNATTPDETVTITYSKADNGDHGNGGNTNPTPNPGDNNNNQGNNGNNGNNNNRNGNGNGISNGNGNGGITTDNNNNGNNGNKAQAKALPQTGNQSNAASVAGLGLASVMAMLGLSGYKKREDK